MFWWFLPSSRALWWNLAICLLVLRSRFDAVWSALICYANLARCISSLWDRRLQHATFGPRLALAFELPQFSICPEHAWRRHYVDSQRIMRLKEEPSKRLMGLQSSWSPFSSMLTCWLLWWHLPYFRNSLQTSSFLEGRQALVQGELFLPGVRHCQPTPAVASHAGQEKGSVSHTPDFLPLFKLLKPSKNCVWRSNQVRERRFLGYAA